MSGAQFQVGDVVRLKSGGPAMTVQRLEHDDTVSCVWFLEGKPEERFFVTSTLQKVPS